MYRSSRITNTTTINWRRGVFRVWLLASVAWVMSWALYLVISDLDEGFQRGAALAVPVVLCGPPGALLIVGLLTRWAVNGFASGTDKRVRS